MVGAMIVSVVVILAFVVVRGLLRDDLEVERDSVDYLPQVADFQQGAPYRIAYPPELPEDWRVTEVGFDDAVGLTWSIDLLTDDDQYVGVRQTRGSAARLLDEFVDGQRIPGDELPLGGLAETWESSSDAGGDHAVIAKVRGTWLLVFGGDEDAIEELAATLVTDRVRED
jgi:hypothetical protein